MIENTKETEQKRRIVAAREAREELRLVANSRHEQEVKIPRNLILATLVVVPSLR